MADIKSTDQTISEKLERMDRADLAKKPNRSKRETVRGYSQSARSALAFGFYIGSPIVLVTQMLFSALP